MTDDASAHTFQLWFMSSLHVVPCVSTQHSTGVSRAASSMLIMLYCISHKFAEMKEINVVMPLTTTRLHVLTGSYSMNSRQQLTFKDSAVLSDSDISMRFLLGEMTDVKTVSPAIETGIINVSGNGFEGAFCLGESFTESGRVLTVNVNDCTVDVQIETLQCCSDQDEVRATRVQSSAHRAASSA